MCVSGFTSFEGIHIMDISDVPEINREGRKLEEKEKAVA